MEKKRTLRRFTIDIDSHNIMRLLKPLFDSEHLLHDVIIDRRVDRTRRGWHIIIRAWCTQEEEFGIRRMFDDQTRLAFDEERQEKYPSHTNVLWDKKHGHGITKDIDPLRGSGFALK